MTWWLFWASIAAVAYVYAGYPMLLWLRARVRPRHVQKKPWIASVSIVIAARNEEAFIGRKIANLLRLDYPAAQLEIIVVSDGSTDRTEEFVKAINDDRVILIALPEHRGKAHALNVGVAAARGELIVFADARQHYASAAVTALVSNFADPAVGAVTGELHLVADDATGTGQAVGLYWRYEKLLRKLESRIDSTVGATGAIYAVRRRLFRPLPDDTVLDDFVIPMEVVMQGYRVVFEPDARAYDRPVATAHDEFARKVRTLAGNYQALVRLPRLCQPWRNRIAFQVLSHKVGRLAVPFLLVVIFVSNLSLREPVYQWVLWGQVAFYGLGILGPWVIAAVNVARVFVVLNAAAVVGLYRYATASRIAWTRPRSPVPVNDPESLARELERR